jgi:hypothetical protein
VLVAVVRGGDAGHASNSTTSTNSAASKTDATITTISTHHEVRDPSFSYRRLLLMAGVLKSAPDQPHASLWHFFMKLAFAAPASGFPFLSTAFGSHASFAHFVRKLLNAAPANGFPFLSIALLWQVPWARAELSASVASKTARAIRFMSTSA